MDNTVFQPSSQPTNKLTAATLGAALIPVIGLFLRNMAPEWYDPEVILGLTPVMTFLMGYLIKDEPNIMVTRNA
jgi:hypothetical protein